MAERDLPLHVFHFDCFWMRGSALVRLPVGPAAFPDPAGMLERLKAQGLRICVWINPYIAQRSRAVCRGQAQGLPAEAARRRRLAVGPCGSRAWASWISPIPEACAWYAGHLRRLVEHGRRLLQDRLRRAHPDGCGLPRRLRPGADAQLLHATCTTRLVFELLSEERGEGEAVVFARSATVGGQRFPVHWGGDCSRTYESMAESLRGGLSLGLSRLRLLEPRHRRLRGHAAGRTSTSAGCAFGLLSVAQPAARQHVLPRAVGLRRGGRAMCCASSRS